MSDSDIYIQLRGQGWFHDLAVRQARLIAEMEAARGLVASQQSVEPSSPPWQGESALKPILRLP